MLLDWEIPLCNSKAGKCATLRTLFDSGSGFSFIRKSIAEKLDWAERDAYKEPLELEMSDGTKLKVKEFVRLQFKGEKDGREVHSPNIEFLLVDNLTSPVIIGALAMEMLGAKLKLGPTPEENEIVLTIPLNPEGMNKLGGIR